MKKFYLRTAVVACLKVEMVFKSYDKCILLKNCGNLGLGAEVLKEFEIRG